MLVCRSSEEKWRAGRDDVTAPCDDVVITGGNGGVEGYPGVAFVWLQSVHVELKPALGLSENNSLC